MKALNVLEILICYLKRHIKTILLFGGYSLVFLIVFYLHNLPLAAVGYGYLLSAFFTVILFIIGFSKYCKTHKTLTALAQRIELSTSGLPEAKDLIESDYHELIHRLSLHGQKLLTQTDQSQSQMMAYYTIWVHQIKTPISALHLLLNSHQTEHTLSMKAELFKIENYAEMALQYIRLSESVSDFRIEWLPLEPIVRNAIRKFRTLFIEKGIGLNFERFDQKILTDEKWFAFAFEQILSNAIKYTHTGTITVALSKEDPYALEIIDTGIGIQGEDIPRIFDKGFTGYNGRLDKKSTGIGLYLCKTTLSKLSHQIEVKSEVGKGTTVKILFKTQTLFIE